MGGMSEQPLRGWFAIGAEAISKEVNFGNLMRTAHAFGAAYLFLVDPATTLRQAGRILGGDRAASEPRQPA